MRDQESKNTLTFELGQAERGDGEADSGAGGAAQVRGLKGGGGAEPGQAAAGGAHQDTGQH